MKNIFTRALLFLFLLAAGKAFAQPVPELLYYKFDGTGTSIPNLASTPPAGTNTATIMGTQTQGGNGQCGGALIGNGNSSSTEYVNTNWATNLNGTSWTLSFWTSNVIQTTSTYYILGDVNAGSIRVFTGGVAGSGNWILRGGFTDVLATGGASTGPSLTTFVYDMAVNEIRAYVNGALVSTVAQTTVSISGPGPFKVGGYSTSASLPPNALMDEFRLYNRALSVAEIQQLMITATSSSISVSSCNSYTVPSGDETYTASGTYMDTIANAAGCDSIMTINVSIINSSASSQSITTCNSYTVPSGDETYTASGTYMDTIPNMAGCDSIITVNLTILNSSTSTQNITACDSYTVPSGNQTYTASGTYMDTIPNMAGCDSIITLNVTINTVDTSVTDNGGATLTANAAGAAYMWIDCSNNQVVGTGQSYMATVNGTYAVIVTQNSCSDTSSCYSIMSVGAKEQLASRIDLYPNPTQGKLTIKCSSQEKLWIEITNILGETVQSEVMTAALNSLDIAGDAGVYFVKISNAGGEHTTIKVIKQ
jgi:hypothetical protein